MRALPGRDNDLDLQRLGSFSSLLIFGYQLSSSHETVPNTTPRTLIFLTQVRPRGSSVRDIQAPSHMASVLNLFNLAPEPSL